MMPDRLEQLRQETEARKKALYESIAGPESGAEDVEGVSGTIPTGEATETLVEASEAQEDDLLEAYNKKATELASKHVEPPKNDQTAELMEMVRALKAELEEVKAKKVVEPVDVVLDADFEEEFPDLAKQMKKAAGMAAAEAKREADALKRELEAIKGQFAAKEQDVEITKHQQVLQASHPDLPEFFTGGKYAAALGAWAMEQPVEFRDAIGNPLKYSPEYVSFVLGQFKAQVLKSAATKSEPKKPASGDVAISVHAKAPKIEPTTGPAPLTAQELASIHKMAEQFKHDPAKLKELRDRISASYGGR